MAEAAESGAAGSAIGRRSFLRYGAATGAAAAAARSWPSLSRGMVLPRDRSAGSSGRVPDFEFEEATIAQLQAMMASGSLTSRQLTQAYIDRVNAIDWRGPTLNSVIELNPDALAIADQLDRERRHGHVRGPLHGIPILLKDNIATKDRMETTAGSLALLGSVPPRDAFVAAGLRAAGAVLLGKTNLSEWANFRGNQSSSGWSGRAGQCLDPYVLDHNPCGSSSGSGAATSANLGVAALGTETDGSIVCPSSNNALAGIKVSLGLTSRSGVIPIAHSQDVVGPMARTVADAATVLGAMTGVDPRDPETRKSRGHFFRDYRPFLDKGALKGARIGIWRENVFGLSPEADAIGEQAIAALKDLGAIIIDPTDIPNVTDSFDPEFTVLLFEFKVDIRTYLSELSNTSMRTLADLIAFNEQHAAQELPWFGQEVFELAQDTDGLHDPAYIDALKTSKKLMINGINGTMDRYRLDAIVSLTDSPPWTTDLVNGDHYIGVSNSTPPAVAGFPNINVLAGYSHDELPVGIGFIGRKWSEPTLIGLAYAFEQGTQLRHAPKFIPSLGVRDFVPRDGARGSGGDSLRSGRSSGSASQGPGRPGPWPL